jgi:sirohydrochlorin cobaltochelatase
MSNRNEATGILIVGHGTRDETGTRQFLELAEVLKERLSPAAVEAAFLEMREPGIYVAVERLVARGIERLVTAPLLLFAAGHIKRDVPGEVEKALVALGRPDLERSQAGHLGCHEGIVELSRWVLGMRRRSALASRLGCRTVQSPHPQPLSPEYRGEGSPRLGACC